MIGNKQSGENLIKGIPEHLKRRGRRFQTGGEIDREGKGIERVIRVFNPTNKAISVSQGEGGYSFPLRANEAKFFSEEGWAEMQKLFTLSDLIDAGFKFEQEFREKKSE